MAVVTVTPERDLQARLIVSDPLPAGLEIENPNLLRSGETGQLAWLAADDVATHTEFRADRFAAAVDWQGAQPFRLAYMVRAVSPGSFHRPAASVEDMYRPAYRARTDAGTVTVREAHDGRRRRSLAAALALAAGAAARLRPLGRRDRAAAARRPRPRRSCSTATARCSPPTPSPTAAGGCRSTLDGRRPRLPRAARRLRGPPLPPPPRRRPAGARCAPRSQSLAAGRVVSGGSTLTMQVARLLEEGPTGTLAGKLRQIRVALALERRLDKDAILALYLTLAPYGGNLEGVRAASLAWLGKEPRRLTPAEAALLVALPQSPEARRPDRAPEAARAARDRVLARAAAAGVLAAGRGRGRARRARCRPSRRPFPALAPHLADRLVAARPGRGRDRDDARRRRCRRGSRRCVRRARARARARHQRGADRRRPPRPARSSRAVGAADRLDPGRGGFVDMSRAVRSPGSTLKPLIYGLAFEAGIAHPETIVEDRPMRFGAYAPQNLDRALARADHRPRPRCRPRATCPPSRCSTPSARRSSWPACAARAPRRGCRRAARRASPSPSAASG